MLCIKIIFIPHLVFSINSCRWVQSQKESPKSLHDLDLMYSLIEVLFCCSTQERLFITLADSISHLFPSWVDISLYIGASHNTYCIYFNTDKLRLSTVPKNTATAPRMNTIFFPMKVKNKKNWSNIQKKQKTTQTLYTFIHF